MAFNRENVLLIFTFVLPLHTKISTLVLLVLVFMAFISLFRAQERPDIKFIPYLAPVLLYLLIATSLLYSKNFEFRYLEQKASLLAFPLIFFTLRPSAFKLNKLLDFFIWGCLIAVLCCYINAIYNATTWIDGKVKFQAVVNSDFSFFYSVVRDGNYFFSSFFSIFHDTIYFAIFLNTAIGIILSRSLWKKSSWYIVVLLLFVIAVFQLSSKMGIITCFLVFVLYVFFRTKKMHSKILLCIGLIAVGFLFFKYNPRGKVMVETFEKNGLCINPKERFGYALRLMSWDAALDLIAKNPMLGVGIGDVNNELNKQYLEKGYTTPLEKNLNAHSEFLQITLESGLFGLLTLIFMFLLLFKTLFDQNHKLLFFNIAFFSIVFLAFLSESTFSRYSGISFFMLFYCLITNKSLYVPKP